MQTPEGALTSTKSALDPPSVNFVSVTFRVEKMRTEKVLLDEPVRFKESVPLSVLVSTVNVDFDFEAMDVDASSTSVCTSLLFWVVDGVYRRDRIEAEGSSRGAPKPATFPSSIALLELEMSGGQVEESA